MKKCIVLGNGHPPVKSIFNFLNNKGYKSLICADGGANTAFKYKLIPEVILGDLDSIKADVYNFYEHRCKIIKISRQNDTDIEKCLKYAHQNRFVDIMLLGVTGDRLDHTFCNLGITLKYSHKFRLRILHHSSLLETISEKVNLITMPNEIISLYGFNKQTKIISDGLKYPLKGISLPFGEKESTSNIAIKEIIKLNISGGKIFIIRDFQTLRKNDFF